MSDDTAETEPSVKKADVENVFQLWVTTYRNSGRGPKPVLSPKRERVIRQALKMYPIEDVEAAVKGLQHSSFHMGQNAQRKRYDDIELILRDSSKIERFATLWYDAEERGDEPW